MAYGEYDDQLSPGSMDRDIDSHLLDVRDPRREPL